MLELDRRVARCRKRSASTSLRLFQNTVALGGRHVGDEGMAAQCMRGGSQAPDVDIVHIEDTRHAGA